MKSKLKAVVFTFLAVLIFVSCQSNKKLLIEQAAFLSKQGIVFDSVRRAEIEADTPGQLVLETARQMVLVEKAILPGTCWTWVNECFIRAGYGDDRYIAYRSYKNGPYVDTDKIRPGDWLYFVNHSYRRIGHSAIFVYWADKERKIGVTLSYPGQNKEEPGRYRKYWLKDVYFITRPGTDSIKINKR